MTTTRAGRPHSAMAAQTLARFRAVDRASASIASRVTAKPATPSASGTPTRPAAACSGAACHAASAAAATAERQRAARQVWRTAPW